MRLDGKTALVTGAGAGIGEGITERLAAAGAYVVATDVDGAAAEATSAASAAAGGKGEGRALDVTDEAAMADSIAELAAARGLDIIVNNAGIAFQTPMVATESAAFRRLLEINVMGVFLGMREAARAMRKRGKGGRIINIASVSGVRGSTGRTAYGASKAAVINMTQVAAVELGPWGITVNAVAPGPIETPLIKAMHTPETRAGWLRHVPQNRYGEPAEIAGACVYLASDEAAFTTGQVLAVDGGFQAAGMLFDLAGDG